MNFYLSYSTAFEWEEDKLNEQFGLVGYGAKWSKILKFFHKQHNKEKAEVYRLTKLCVDTLRKNYQNIYLITDNLGKEIFENINWSGISTELESINFKKYPHIWSLGKLYAINIIANKGNPFIHIDYDFFITKKLSDEVINSDILVQSKEYQIDFIYNTKLYNEVNIKRYLNNYKPINFSYNCGIVGGKNFNFWKEYSSKAISQVEDPENTFFWQSKTNDEKWWSKAVLAEQYYLTCLLEEKNVKPTFIFDNYLCERNYSPFQTDYFKDTGAIHFLGPFKSNIKRILNPEDINLKNINDIYDEEKFERYNIPTQKHIEEIKNNNKNNIFIKQHENTNTAPAFTIQINPSGGFIVLSKGNKIVIKEMSELYEIINKLNNNLDNDIIK